MDSTSNTHRKTSVSRRFSTRILLFVSGVFFLAFGVGVASRFGLFSDASLDDTSRGHTRFRLKVIAGLIGSAEDSNVRMTDCNSIGEILERAAQNHLVDRSEIAQYKEDGWGNEFLDVHHSRNGLITITVISKGPNQTFDGGKGDDIIQEVVIRPC